jgi:phosphate-selective porin OprO/OprP
MTKPIVSLLAATILSLSLHAADEASSSSMQDTYDKIWSYATLYSNKDNSFIQKLAFTGRLQYDYAYFDEKDTGSWDDNAWRRARAGFKATVFQKFTVHAEMNMDLNNTDPVYDGITDAYVAWKPGNTWTIKVGKQSAGFTLDGATSSKNLITIERGKLSENFWFTFEYFTGVTLSAKKDNWIYNFGVFSNDRSKAFESVGEEKYFLLFDVGYDFSKRLDVDNAVVHVHYVYNQESSQVGTKDLSDILSLNGQYDNGRYHLWADLTFAKNFEEDNMWGIEIMPFFDLNDTFQIVASYNHVSSSEDNRLVLGRYDRRLVAGRVDKIDELYLGLNTYFYGNKLKWQNGIQFTEADDSANDGGDYSGIGFTSAIRLYW